MIQTILVVCVGNVCRSPMAQYLFSREVNGVTVLSAGLSAVVGSTPDPLAIRVAAEAGLDITAHRAQQLNVRLVRGADLILTMEAVHRHEIMRQYPGASGKVFRIGEIGHFDVPDPYRKPVEQFYSSLELIRKGVDAWAPRIRAMA
ncbi:MULTISPECIES: low molecular weight protein-tyrosine-phosphatase [Paraburkholderia]|jgi:protein-tyrosine phosphatase|uniref:protein-tyrosine-phosphatase n=1 Tax=Paraburkholderia largidicola TaxID=3014751 RepID=A0A7I8BPI5_9BURK|nr:MULTISPECIES: low molecular weight protein-tyrosine-phosphatase [Paraburkholderia]BCF90403.1 protein-tyrosine-phosphatase [Paraburkholderia sp. PGU16]BEU24197.1 low molecular weight protein-tyrosine-phosphatase [Paraburkholderia sp. 22B1P]GJH36962.1 low molecular weight phosphotyrosine protein phosphatase [Paraburkholderia hospita]CAG9272356.1 protein-tyrosine phosphatase [Paraburkholderia caribensis]